LSASPSALTVGNTFTLTWSSTNATSCTASGGGADGSTWSGPLATSGSVVKTATKTNTFGYEIQCENTNSTLPDATMATAEQDVTVSAAGASGGTSSVGEGGGHGGGGEIDPTSVVLLGLLTYWGQRRH